MGYKLVISNINHDNEYLVELILKKHGYAGAFKFTGFYEGYLNLVTPKTKEEDNELYLLVGEFVCSGFVSKIIKV